MSLHLFVLAGPNGSGKSTLFTFLSHRYSALNKIPFVNPDEISKSIQGLYLQDGSATSNSVTLQAGRLAILQRNELLDKNNTFALETTFSGTSEQNLIKEAHKQGYHVTVVFISTEEPFLNVARVHERIMSGGHYVAPEIIMRRYEKSLKNIINIIPYAKRIYLFDNSSEKFKVVATLKNKDFKHYINMSYLQNITDEMQRESKIRP